MEADVKVHLQHVFSLIEGTLHVIEMAAVSDGSRDSKLAILEEIERQTDNIKNAANLL